MAKHDSKLKTTPSKDATQRFYTVGYVPNGGYANPRPQLTIKGRWLEQIGFFVGQPVIVKIGHNKLIIELTI